MERIFALVDRYCFQGHTHVPGIFIEQAPDDLYVFHSPEEIDYVHALDDRKTLCNVGSVGQPRDGDPRACYILLDGTTIRYRRVEYDIETTIKKIYAVPELENFLGDRLRDGRGTRAEAGGGRQPPVPASTGGLTPPARQASTHQASHAAQELSDIPHRLWRLPRRAGLGTAPTVPAGHEAEAGRAGDDADP